MTFYVYLIKPWSYIRTSLKPNPKLILTELQGLTLSTPSVVLTMWSPCSRVCELYDGEGGDGGEEVEQGGDPPVGVVRVSLSSSLSSLLSSLLSSSLSPVGVVRVAQGVPGEDAGRHRHQRPRPRHRELGGRTREPRQGPALPPPPPHIWDRSCVKGCVTLQCSVASGSP